MVTGYSNPRRYIPAEHNMDCNELDEKLPAKLKRQLAAKNANFYIINGTAIAGEIGLGNRINTVLQAAFFKLANIIPIDEAVEYMKAAITASYCKKGDAIVR